jgi:hypothetical protein
MAVQMRSMETAPKDGRDILIREADGRFMVVHWDSSPYYGGEFGWTQDGGNRFTPSEWFDLDEFGP